MEQQKLGLVEYIGTKIASFTVSYKTGKQSVQRMWANMSDNSQSRMIKKRRWLPEAEALFYNKLPEFRVLRWGSDTTELPKKPVSSFSDATMPEAQAIPISVLLQQQAAAMAQMAPPDAIVTKEQPVEAVFVMSKSGMAHKADCPSGKRIKEPEQFYTVEDVIAAKDFKKWHKCCEGAI